MSKFIKYRVDLFHNFGWGMETIKVLTIEEISHNLEISHKRLTFGDNDNNEWENKNSTFTLKYDIQKDAIAAYFNCFRFYSGCQIIPPNDEWLKKFEDAVKEYNEYYSDKSKVIKSIDELEYNKVYRFKFDLNDFDDFFFQK